MASGTNHSKEYIDLVCQEYNTGDAATVIAARLHTTRSAIIGIWHRAGLKRTPGGGEGKINVPGINLGHYIKELPRPTTEPSPAMIRLAKHDPVVNRALRQRRGEDVTILPPVSTGPGSPDGFS